MFTSITAAQAGTEAAAAVADGVLTPEQAGDMWLRFADESHAAGVAFLAAYDNAGGAR